MRTLADGSTTLTMPGRAEAFYRTRNRVREARLFAPSPGRTETVVALWNERDARGVETPARAISLDGGATVPSGGAGLTRYDIPLRFVAGGFTPAWTGVTRPGAGEAAAPGAVGEGEPAIPAGLRAGEGNRLWIVQFVTQPLQEYRDAITAAGGEIHRWLAHHCYVVEMDAGAVQRVAALPFVRWVGSLHPAYRIDPALITAGMAAGTPSHDPATSRRYNILVNRRGLADKAAVAAAVEMLGGRVDFGVDEYGFVLGATMTEAQLLAVLCLSRVGMIELWHPASECTDIALRATGASYLQTTPGLQFTGRGVRGEVMDAEFLATHMAFTSPAPRAPIRHGTEEGSNPKHGTSTYGIVFGSQPATTVPPLPGFTGFLPQGDGIFATRHRLPEGGPNGTVPREVHTAELLDPAGPYRAVFQSNSWGSGATLLYSIRAAELDDILVHYDITVLQAQGNYGTAIDPRLSMEQAIAKNVVSVGGLKHRNSLSRLDDRWDPCDLCDCGEDGDCHGMTVSRCRPYFAYDCLPICPECVPTFCPPNYGFIDGSSVGPTKEDERVKPDLVGFYDALRAPGANLCDSLTRDMYNDNFGGTSGATPMVAGCVGLIQQMRHEGVFPGFASGSDVFESRFRASTVKALLVNSAYQYPFPGESGGYDLGRGQQGWGMPDLQRLYESRNATLVIDESERLTALHSYSIFVAVEPVRPFRATLVYRDPAGYPAGGYARVNDLDLTVVTPEGKYYGNGGLMDGRWSLPETGPDDRNTVENVFVESPGEGTWGVVVTATEVNLDGDPSTPEIDAVFALVISGVACPQCSRAPDWDGNGRTDPADLAAFLADLPRGQADADGDGRTTASDAAAFVRAFLAHAVSGEAGR